MLSVTTSMPDEAPSFPDHEHAWVLLPLRDGMLLSTGERANVHLYRCTACGMEITKTTRPGIQNVEIVGPVSVYLHTCGLCGKQYHDGNPFSELSISRDDAAVKFCSLACYAETKERWRKEDLAKLIPSLETMVATATNDVARVLADERLRVIATDEDEPLRSQARDALKRARQKRKESAETHPAAAK